MEVSGSMRAPYFTCLAEHRPSNSSVYFSSALLAVSAAKARLSVTPSRLVLSEIHECTLKKFHVWNARLKYSFLR